MASTINLGELKTLLKYFIENNKNLQDTKRKPISVNIESDAGMGKTSVVEQVAREAGMTFVKLNLSQLDEIGDLTGFPVKEYQMSKEDTIIWVSNDLLEYYISAGYVTTGESRMGYAAPKWLPKEENPNGTILLLDDYTRATSIFLQAVMELIDRQEYISWKLPKYTTIVMTSNPDDGSYMVSSLDNAQKSRMVTFNVRFDIDAWAAWAEQYGIQNQAINFALYYSAELFCGKEGIKKVNPRSYVTFCNAISGINDWSDTNSLAKILDISKGCFPGDDNNSVGNMFTMFVNNKLDKLIDPKTMLLEDFNVVAKRMEECIYDNHGNYNSAIASILATRIINYSISYMEDKNNGKESQRAKIVCDRIFQIIEHKGENGPLFAEDIVFHVAKTLYSVNSKQMVKLLHNETIREKILGK